MKRTSATYSHSTIGFPAIVLKWHEEDGVWLQPYVTIKGVIQPPGSMFTWHWKTHSNAALYAESEMAAFDSFIRHHFADDSSVQG